MADRQPSKWFYGSMLAGGKPLMDDQEGFDELKRSLDSKRIRIRLEECRPTTELERLRGYFHREVLPAIARAAGYSLTKEELKRCKDGLKERFLTVPAAPGEPTEVRSTETLSREEYSMFISECIQYAAETFSLPIRDPRAGTTEQVGA